MEKTLSGFEIYRVPSERIGRIQHKNQKEQVINFNFGDLLEMSYQEAGKNRKVEER